MARTRLATAIFMAAVTLTVLVWDVIMAIEPTPRDTISKVFLDLSREHMTLPMVAGALLGHLTWPLRMATTEPQYWRLSLPGLLLVVAATVALDHVAHVRANPAMAFVLGYVVGHLLWPQAEVGT